MRKKVRFSTGLYNLEKEVKIDFYKSSGPGGQRKNKRETAVRIHHPPSGVTVTATEHRSQIRNKELAFNRLREKLRQLNKIRKRRIPTRKSRAVKKKELGQKKKHSEKKKGRARIEKGHE